MNPRLFIPEQHRQQLAKKRAYNAVLDFIYANILKKRNNSQILRRLRRAHLPDISDENLNGMRDWFKKAEADKPEFMAKMKAKLRGGA